MKVVIPSNSTKKDLKDMEKKIFDEEKQSRI